jgi:hypothetical protein
LRFPAILCSLILKHALPGDFMLPKFKTCAPNDAAKQKTCEISTGPSLISSSPAKVESIRSTYQVSLRSGEVNKT